MDTDLKKHSSTNKFPFLDTCWYVSNTDEVEVVLLGVVDDEGVDGEDAEDVVDLVVGEVVLQPAGEADKVDDLPAVLAGHLVELVVVVHEEGNEVVDLGVAPLQEEDAHGEDGVVVGAGLVEPGDLYVHLKGGFAFVKEDTLLGKRRSK